MNRFKRNVFVRKYIYVEANSAKMYNELILKTFKEVQKSRDDLYWVDSDDIKEVRYYMEVYDIPFPKDPYMGVYEEDDFMDWVDNSSGKTVLPYSKQPSSSGGDYIYRPSDKVVTYNGRTFCVQYYHDGTAIGIYEYEGD